MKKLILATVDNISNKDYEIIDFIFFTNKDIAIYEYWFEQQLNNPNQKDIQVTEKQKNKFGIKKEVTLENPLKVLQFEQKVDAVIGIKPDYHLGYNGSNYTKVGIIFNESRSDTHTDGIANYIGTAIRFKTNKK